MKRTLKITLVIFFILLLDQALKIWVKTHFQYEEEIKILGLDWARIHFVENPGMAFGITLGPGEFGKLLLSLFRIVAVGLLFFFIHYLNKTKASWGVVLSFSFILAGAMGNIIDSAFYGLIFSATPYHGGGVAEIFPLGGGYAPFLQGKVVDMLHFPVWQGYLPEWLPLMSGHKLKLFSPVFNIADISITVGVLNILLFHRSFFMNTEEEESSLEEADREAPNQEANQNQ